MCKGKCKGNCKGKCGDKCKCKAKPVDLFDASESHCTYCKGLAGNRYCDQCYGAGKICWADEEFYYQENKSLE